MNLQKRDNPKFFIQRKPDEYNNGKPQAMSAQKGQAMYQLNPMRIDIQQLVLSNLMQIQSSQPSP